MLCYSHIRLIPTSSTDSLLHTSIHFPLPLSNSPVLHVDVQPSAETCTASHAEKQVCSVCKISALSLTCAYACVHCLLVRDTPLTLILTVYLQVFACVVIQKCQHLVSILNTRYTGIYMYLHSVVSVFHTFLYCGAS